MGSSWTGESILKLARSYQDSQALLAAAELEVFDQFESGPRSAREVAEALSLDPRGTEILLNALAAQQLLTKSGDVFSIPEDVQPLVSAHSEATVLPMVRHHVTCGHRWDRLADVVRTGHSASDVVDKMDEVDRRAFIQAMDVIGRHMAEHIVTLLDVADYRRALDVGGASGTYTIALLKASPEMRVTLFDLPPVIEMAQDRLVSEGLLDRVDLAAGDFYKDDLPAGHDVVLLSAIIHQNSREQNRDLFSKCYAALDPDGVIVIRDIIMDDSHTQPPGGAQFAINMLVGTEAGGTYSFVEIEADLEAAGFGGVELVQRGTWMDGLVRAVRPS